MRLRQTNARAGSRNHRKRHDAGVIAAFPTHPAYIYRYLSFQLMARCATTAVASCPSWPHARPGLAHAPGGTQGRCIASPLDKVLLLTGTPNRHINQREVVHQGTGIWGWEGCKNLVNMKSKELDKLHMPFIDNSNYPGLCML